MIEVIGWIFMVMIISIVPVFFGCVIISIINESKQRKVNDESEEDDEPEEELPPECPICIGTGMGQRADTTCHWCHGSGIAPKQEDSIHYDRFDKDDWLNNEDK